MFRCHHPPRLHFTPHHSGREVVNGLREMYHLSGSRQFMRVKTVVLFAARRRLSPFLQPPSWLETTLRNGPCISKLKGKTLAIKHTKRRPKGTPQLEIHPIYPAPFCPHRLNRFFGITRSPLRFPVPLSMWKILFVLSNGKK